MQWEIAAGYEARREQHYGDRIISCFVKRPRSLPAMLSATCSIAPEGEAIVCDEVRLDWREVEERTSRIAAGLRARGVRAGDRIALLLRNRIEFVLAFFAAFRIGAVTVPLSTRYQTPEIAYALSDCDAAMLIFEADLLERLPGKEDMPPLRLIAIGGEARGAEAWEALPADVECRDFAPREEDTAVILYTSGTTGRPKGAMLTHLSLINSALVFCRCFELTEKDRSIAAVPLAHVTGLVANILAMLASRGTLIILPEFKAKAFLDLAEKERSTYTIIVPAMYKLCLMQPDFATRDLTSWRIGGFGGAPMPEPTIQELAEKLPTMKPVNCYGATETSSPATIMPPEEMIARLSSVGLPGPNCDILVVDDHGAEVPRGETGEIWIGGPSVVSGYWNRPDATAESFTAGYWHSGDIGMMDQDGFVHVLDRKKDMIVRGGLKIYSAEVESVLSDCPGVVESAIVSKPCPVLGERVHAFIRVDERQPGEAEIARFAAARLADYKVPETFTLSSDPLPRNSNGKVMKRLLRERLAAATRA
ncbi:MAG TPA: class I adenylate-forming enzyme family protein [Rhizobiaceae bacterium]|nr:class I adenylate-forming enzyme family protein [Rhizobiaceae bacterium]